MMRRDLTLAAMLLAGFAAPGGATESGLRLAQSVNEQLPGGVEHRPSASDKALGSARSTSPPRPVPPPAPAAAAPVTAPLPPADAKSATKKKRSSKKSAPTRAMPPAMERAPAESMPKPGKPDESIPGGVERSPPNAQ